MLLLQNGNVHDGSGKEDMLGALNMTMMQSQRWNEPFISLPGSTKVRCWWFVRESDGRWTASQMG